jgi:RNase H-like domain found in reverse transcriptase
METDASMIAYGAVLLQEYEDNQFPVAYFSGRFTKAEKNYATG